MHTTDESHDTGEVVDDFGNLAGAQIGLTARGRRWAVALVDAGLTFCDDDSIEVDRS